MWQLKACNSNVYLHRNEYEYYLFMNPDYGTLFTQFFYFKVNNTKTGIV